MVCNVYCLPADCVVLSQAGTSERGKPVQYSAVTVTKERVLESIRNDFTDAGKLFAYMIEPVTPAKFFKWVNLLLLCAVVIVLAPVVHHDPK